jgi:hypothetical protein
MLSFLSLNRPFESIQNIPINGCISAGARTRFLHIVRIGFCILLFWISLNRNHTLSDLMTCDIGAGESQDAKYIKPIDPYGHLNKLIIEIIKLLNQMQ